MAPFASAAGGKPGGERKPLSISPINLIELIQKKLTFP